MDKQKPVNLTDLMTPEEQERVVKREEARTAMITREWMAVAELGYYYGWGAIQDLLNDVITLPQAKLFVEGARKIHSSEVYDLAVANIAGNSSKKGQFEKTMKYYIKDMRTVG